MNKKSFAKSKKLSKKTLSLLIMRCLISATALAMEPNPHDPTLAGAINQMRQRQEAEENSVIRVIQQPVMLQTMQVCSPAEQARQRLRNLDESKQGLTVNVEGSFGDVSVDNNSDGTTINQVVQPIMPGVTNERSCL